MSSSSTWVQAPPAAFNRERSESSRNRLHVRSIASSSRSTSATAVTSLAERVTTTTVVPRAGNDDVAMSAITNPRK